MSVELVNRVLRWRLPLGQKAMAVALADTIGHDGDGRGRQLTIDWLSKTWGMKPSHVIRAISRLLEKGVLLEAELTGGPGATVADWIFDTEYPARRRGRRRVRFLR